MVSFYTSKWKQCTGMLQIHLCDVKTENKKREGKARPSESISLRESRLSRRSTKKSTNSFIRKVDRNYRPKRQDLEMKLKVTQEAI